MPENQSSFPPHAPPPTADVVPRLDPNTGMEIMPKIVDHDVRREQVIEAAVRLIARVGLEGSTMRAIAEEADCSTGLVTHYFADREDLIVGVLRHVHRRSAQRMRRHLDADRLAAEVLAAVILEALPLDAERSIEWKVWLAFWGAAVGDEALAREHRARYQEWRAVVRRLVGEAVGEASFRADLAVRSETDRIVALVDGLGLQATLAPDQLRARRVRTLVVEHLASLR